MRIWKVMVHGTARIGRQTCSAFKSLMGGFKPAPRRPGLQEREVERLDRIRNPSKYLGQVNAPDINKESP